MLAALLTALMVALAPAQPMDAGRTLSHSVILEASAAEVWTALTTPDGIKRTWAVALAEVDFRLGGTIRTNYNPKGAIGDEGTITHHIIAYEPERMLAMRTDAPADAPEELKLICDHGWVVIRLESLSPTRTRLTETGLGYGEGELWDKAYAFFARGNAWTLEHMRKSFETPEEAARVEQAWALLARLVDGHWIHEKRTDQGGVFRVRNAAEWGPDEQSIILRGWLGDASGMFYHNSAMLWRDAATAQVRYQSIHENGGTAAGAITLIDESTVEWDWPETTPDGRLARFIVVTSFTGPDEYRMVLSRVADDGARTPMVDAMFRRVAQAPAEFVRLKAKPAAGP